ncbi:hypothetical protein [Tsuneonella sp. HG222]
METEPTPQFTKISAALDFSRFQVAKPEKREPTEREHYTQLTAKLIGRSFMAAATLMGDWPLEKIIRHYELCTKHCGDMPGDVKWWWLRKKEKPTRA